MKKFFAIFTAVVLLPVSQTMAWTGGPFSNNSALPGGDDGIYEAIATMSNGVGMYRFGVRNNGVSSQAFAGGGGGGGGGTTTTQAASSNVQFNAGLLNAFSSNVWFYKGITYYGSAFGMANTEMGIVSAVGNASSSVGGEVPNPAQGQIVLPSVNGAVVGGPAGNNVGFANSSWVAKMEDKGPSFRFSGRGQVNFLGAADALTTVEAINPAQVATNTGLITPLTAVGDGTNPGNTLTTTTSQVNSTSTTSGGGTLDGTLEAQQSETTFNSSTRLATGGEETDFPERGHARKFLVFGTKVSHTVAP